MAFLTPGMKTILRHGTVVAHGRNGQHNPNETMYESVDSILTRWSSYYSCSTIPDTILMNGNYLIKRWSCGDTNIDIILYVMQKGAHQWFTTDNSGIDANEIIWEFFKSHPKTKKSTNKISGKFKALT